MSTHPDMPPPNVSMMAMDDGRTIAIRHRAARAGMATIVFLPGYASDMDGAKAVAIDQFCAARGLGCLRLDYSGTGLSPGDFADGTLERWLSEALTAIDMNILQGKVIVAGSSMGGWLALHVAWRLRDRVAGVCGIAAAPDFTDWGYTQDEKMALLEAGRLEKPNPYGDEPQVTHRAFWQSGEALRMLGAAFDISCPVRLVHGELDQEVGLGVPIKLMNILRSSDVQLNIIKNGGHRLSEPHEIHAILMALHNLVELAR